MSTTIKAAWIAFAAVIFAALLGGVFTLIGRQPSQQQVNSPNAVQVQGNNNTVNQTARYVWTNKNTWESTWNDGTKSIELDFTASEGILPSYACFSVTTDANINVENFLTLQEQVVYQETFREVQTLQLGRASGCGTPTLPKLKVQVFFDKKPSIIVAEVVSP